MTRYLFVRSINPINYPFLLLISPFLKIHYWKKEKLSFDLLKPFSLLDPMEFVPKDEWLETEQKIHTVWKKLIETNKLSASRTKKVCGIPVDFSRHWLQDMSIQFGDEHHFYQFCLAWLEKHKVTEKAYRAGTMFDGLACQNKIELNFEHLKKIEIFTFFDWLWFLTKNLVNVVSYIKSAVLSWEKNPCFNSSIKYIFCGVNRNEMRSGPGKLSFSFLIERNLIKPDEALYVLPFKPTRLVKEKLKQFKVQWICFKDLPSLLFLGQRFRFLLVCLTSLFNQNHVRSTMFALVAKKLKPTTLLYSVSAAWPENPEVAVMNALGVRTVNWHYSSNVFWFKESREPYPDKGLTFSLSQSKEVWVWNALVKDFLTDRQLIENDPHVHIKGSGSVMCGNAAWLNRPLDVVRKEAHVPHDTTLTFISVFDVPTTPKSSRIEIGLAIEPYPLETLDQFFKDLLVVLDQFPNVRMIFKPKRNMNFALAEYAQSMTTFIDHPHVVLLDDQIDPYIPIAAGDFSVGLPFTSPVAVGMGMGRPGLFYDPESKVNAYRPKAYSPFVIKGREALVEKVREWINGQGRIPEKDQSIFSGQVSDPGIKFASLLKGEMVEIEPLQPSGHSLKKIDSIAFS